MLAAGLEQEIYRYLPHSLENVKNCNDARRSLLKMSVDYTVELVWIMSKYNGCSRETIAQLLRTPTIRRYVATYQARIEELLKDFPPA